MNTYRNYPWTIGLMVTLFAIPLVASADSVLHGRISFDAGGTLLKGTEESDWSSGSVNTLILPGDTVWIDDGDTTEIEFSGGTFLRMADGSKAEVVGLGSGTSVRGWIGSFYVHRLSRSSGEFVFYTPAGIVQVEKDSSVRIDIVGEGITTVSTRWGRATVRTDAGGAVEAHSGRRVFVESGLLPSEPTPFDRTLEDEFDRWNRERAEFYATGTTQTPAAVQISASTLGAEDLGHYGEWVYVDNNPFWRPTVVVDYTPYHYGYWNHVNRVGSVWVGNYPFSYITSHHGYWDYNARYGWIWSYESRWSPARCATVRYGDYMVWSPINRYYHPVYPTTSAHFSIGGVSFGFYGTSYVHVDHLYQGPSYVNYAHHNSFRNYYGRSNVTVNIWNINTNRQPDFRVPYNNSLTTVRDYTPRRSIRGASTLFPTARGASERVQRLEASNGRPAFSRASRTGSEFVRTGSANSNDSSRVRTARINQSTPDYARATRGNPVRASNDTMASVRANNNRSTDSDAAVRSGSRSNRGGEGNVTPREASGSRGAATSNGRSGSSRTNARNTPVPQRTDIDPQRSRGDSFDSSVPVRTYTRTPEPSRSSDRTQATTRTPASARTEATTRTPVRSSDTNIRSRTDSARMTSPSAVESGRSSTQDVIRPPQRTEAAPTRTTRPEVRSPQNTPTRTATPRETVSRPQVSTPSRASTPTESRGSRSSTPDRSYTAPAPRSVTPRSVEPRSVEPRNSRPSVSSPSRQPASRSVLPSTAPSRSSEGRSVSRNSASSGSSSASTRGNSRGR